MTKRRHLGRDLALYALIGVAVPAILVAAAYSRLPEPFIMKWFGFFLFTAGVFGFLIEKTRPFWKAKLFWAWAGLLLILHCGVLEAVLLHGGEFRKIFWAFVVEMIFLIHATRLVFRHNTNRTAPHRKLPDL
jgi:hypothetical protein